jgi:deazaflavin-dependent oxidoreductase (nitroreductase family)
MMMLTVRGRKSGVPRTNPVDLFEHAGRYWLVATHTRDANWVQNLRAAGQGSLALGCRRLTFTAMELSQAESGVVLKEVLGPRLARPVAGFVLRQTIGVSHDAPLAEFTAAAAVHPVFELSLDSAPAPPANPPKLTRGKGP